MENKVIRIITHKIKTYDKTKKVISELKKIENAPQEFVIHWTPYSMVDICNIIYTKFSIEFENIFSTEVIIELTIDKIIELFKENLIGHVYLSELEHQSVHLENLIISNENVLGDVNKFRDEFVDYGGE